MAGGRGAAARHGCGREVPAKDGAGAGRQGAVRGKLPGGEAGRAAGRVELRGGRRERARVRKGRDKQAVRGCGECGAQGRQAAVRVCAAPGTAPRRFTAGARLLTERLK